MANEIVLVEYDKACRQLARARSAKEIEQIRGVAIIMRAAAKVMRNKDAEADFWELRVRAEHRLGEELVNGKDERAHEGGDGSSRDPSKPTLQQLRIGKALANRARQLAAMTNKEFEIFVIDGRANVRFVSERIGVKRKSNSRELVCPACGHRWAR